MKSLICLAVALSFGVSGAFAESLSFNEAKRALPRATAKPVVTTYADRVPEADKAKLTGANQSLDDVLGVLGGALQNYGAVAISPSEGLFVEWLNGVSQFHSTATARAAAIAYCNGQKKSASAPCVVIAETAPKGAKPGFSLSANANAALRRDYRKLAKPRAFAISDATGNFGMARGDGGRAMDACEKAAKGASDCRIVIAD